MRNARIESRKFWDGHDLEAAAEPPAKRGTMLVGMHPALTDDLVLAASRGDRSALDAVSMAVHDQIHVMVAARLSPTPSQLDAVDDLAQQCAMGLCEGIGRLQTPNVGGLKAYLSGIVTRRVADYLRSLARDRERGPVRTLNGRHTWATSQAFSSVLAASGATPSSLMGRAEQSQRLLEALRQLKDEYRQVITLAFFDQLPTSVAADLMGISRPAASMLLLRAVRALGRALASDTARSEDHAT